MWQLILFELKKIFQKKIVYAALAGTIFSNIIIYSAWGAFGDEAATMEGEELNGMDAVLYMKEFDRQYEGELSDEKVEELLACQNKMEEMNAVYAYYRCLDITSYVKSRFDAGQEGILSVDDVFTQEMGNIHFGYHKSFSSAFQYMMNMIMIMGCVLVIALAPIFSEEYTKGTDALILTTRYGKSKCAKAKIFASFLSSFGILFILIVLNGSMFLATYGTEGWNTSVQIDYLGFLWDIPYEMNYAQFMGYSVFLWFVSYMFLTGMVLILSAFCQSSFVSLIIASVCYVVPMWIHTIMPIWFNAMMPILQLMVVVVLNIQRIHVFGCNIMPLWIVVSASTAVTIFFCILAKKGFTRHQVM